MFKRNIKPDCGIYVTNPKHELYKTNSCFFIHYKTNAGYMIKYCNIWYTIPFNDAYAVNTL